MDIRAMMGMRSQIWEDAWVEEQNVTSRTLPCLQAMAWAPYIKSKSLGHVWFPETGWSSPTKVWRTTFHRWKLPTRFALNTSMGGYARVASNRFTGQCRKRPGGPAPRLLYHPSEWLRSQGGNMASSGDKDSCDLLLPAGLGSLPGLRRELASGWRWIGFVKQFCRAFYKCTSSERKYALLLTMELGQIAQCDLPPVSERILSPLIHLFDLEAVAFLSRFWRKRMFCFTDKEVGEVESAILRGNTIQTHHLSSGSRKSHHRRKALPFRFELLQTQIVFRVVHFPPQPGEGPKSNLWPSQNFSEIAYPAVTGSWPFFPQGGNCCEMF